jgi:hypothetical protein
VKFGFQLTGNYETPISKLTKEKKKRQGRLGSITKEKKNTKEMTNKKLI